MMNAKAWCQTGGLILASLGLVASPSAFAQSGAVSTEGRLDARSPKYDDKPYSVTTVTLESGKRYVFDAISEAFDTGLRISFADDNDEVFAEDDDGGEGTNANIEFTPPRTGKYRIRVSSINGDQGRYTLRQSNLPPLPALLKPAPSSTATMQIKSYKGVLSATDGLVRGRYVDDYVFQFVAGKAVFISMDRDNDDLDPMVEVFAGNNRNQSSAVASDDDSGEGNNAMINFVPETSGEYIVRASSVGDVKVNQGYTLRVGQLP